VVFRFEAVRVGLGGFEASVNSVNSVAIFFAGAPQTKAQKE
jgi:hypothetical protein